MNRLLILAVTISSMAAAISAKADILFESGTLGPTGVPWSDVENQLVSGTTTSAFVYNGVRFQLAQRALTTEIGGHFVASSGGTFFGAIVALDDEDDFPDSGNLSTPDVLGHSLLGFPTLSAMVSGDLSVSLDPGWYALVFGSGLFGATGAGATLNNNPDIANPQYIGQLPQSDSAWFNLSNPIFRNYRFVVEGHVVPEPATVGLMTAVALIGLLIRTPRRH